MFERYTMISKNAENVPTKIISSNSSVTKQISALTKLKLFKININSIFVGVERTMVRSSKGDYASLTPSPGSTESITYFHKDKSKYRATKIIDFSSTEIKSPFIFNFRDVKGKEKFSLLHLALLARRGDLIEPLVSLGLDINQKTHYGYTPLALAIEFGQLDTAKKLLQLGADPSVNHYLAYKIAYLLQRLNIKGLSSSYFPVSIKTVELTNLMAKMKLKNKTERKLKNEINNQFPIKVKLTTVKLAADYYNYDYDNVDIQEFFNGKKIK